MPDITMCTGKDCPLKDDCYRYTAFPNLYYQSYFRDPPYKDGECNHFWNNEGRRNTPPEDRE